MAAVVLDAVVIGAGPNGLSAAIVLARAGLRVRVIEAAPTPGGGCRTGELTIPGCRHDVCAAVHPMAVASPFFRTVPLARYGVEWVQPPAMLAHPFDDRPATVVHRSMEETAAGLGDDAGAYRTLVGTIVAAWPRLEDAVLGPPRWPRHPVEVARFGLAASSSAARLATRSFSTVRARGLVAGLAAHSMLPLDRLPTGAVALVLAAVAHTAGWAFPRGGAQRIADALAGYFQSLGGDLVTGQPVESIDDLPAARAILCDLSPRPFLAIAGHVLPGWYTRALTAYRYGMGAFKMDWALDGPIPWTDSSCALAGTVHLGGPLEAIAESERRAWSGGLAARPFTILAQPTLFDDARAPAGVHTAWAYCHVPHGSTSDAQTAIEDHVERFAPGFRARILARHVTTPAGLEAYNPNYVGGDIGAGVADVRQLVARPTRWWYRTPRPGLYLCSASTPPGVGVHGMCGYHAARRALDDLFPGRPDPAA